MKICQDYLLKRNKLPIKKWVVPSRSHTDKKYDVSLFQDGSFECNCTAGTMNRECSHVRLIKKMNPRKRLNLKYVYYPDKCFFCERPSTSYGLDEHHLWRGPDRLTSPTIWLCRRCHDRATLDHEFSTHLQELYEQRKENN